MNLAAHSDYHGAMGEGTGTERRSPSGLAWLYWRGYYLVLRVAMGAVFFVGATVAARRVGVWFTLPMAVCAAALVCGFVAMKLSWAGGRVSYVNRLAVIVLPLGMRARGARLVSMFAWSAGLWAVVGMAGAIYGGMSSHGAQHAPGLRVLLIASLFVDGVSLVMLVQQAVRSLTLKSPGMRPVVLMLAGLVAMMVGGVGLWMADWPRAAVLVAGGPIVVVGGFYGVFFLMLAMNPPK
jgi:hypothetical protein